MGEKSTPGDVAVRVFEAMNGRDLTGLSSLMAPDGVFHFPGAEPLVGPDVIGRFLKILLRRFPVLRFETGRVIEQGDRVAVEWTNRGEDRKGVAYENAGVTVIELREGRIAYMSDTFKDTSIFSR